MDLSGLIKDIDHLRILSPSGAHTKFRIQGRDSQTRKWKTLKLPELDIINKLYLNKTSTKEHTKEKCNQLLAQLYEARDKLRPEAILLPDNQKILERYIEARYPLRKTRRLVAPEAAIGDLNRAVLACGNLPLDSVSSNKLQDYIDDQFHDNPPKQRRICTWLNMILKWLGRDFKLELYPLERDAIKHLTEDEFKSILPYFKRNDMRVLAKVAYYTGLRLGECFAIQASDIVKEKVLLISRQVDRHKELTKTKTKGTRKVWLSPEARIAVKEWLDIPEAEKLKLRSLRIAEKTRQACKKAFPDNKSKHCKFHDLRHSYAINLLSKGTPLSHVAQSLGNSNEVCERYYVGYTLSDESLDLIERLHQ